MWGRPAHKVVKRTAVRTAATFKRRVFDWRWVYVPQRVKREALRNAALIKQLKVGARLADRGLGTDTADMSDEEFLALLRRR